MLANTEYRYANPPSLSINVSLRVTSRGQKCRLKRTTHTLYKKKSTNQPPFFTARRLKNSVNFYYIFNVVRVLFSRNPNDSIHFQFLG